MRRVVLLTGHFPAQRRRASFHWIGEGFLDRGWHVTHATVGYSWLSRLAGDRRLASLESPPRPGTRTLSDRLDAVFGWSPIHPFSTGHAVPDRLLAPLQALFTLDWSRRLRPALALADLVLVESGAPVALISVARRLAPRATLIYRVNDDLRLLGLPGGLIAQEAALARICDRVSTASPHLAARFDHPNVTLDPMGVPLTPLRGPFRDPYDPRARREAVCAGTTQLDADLLLAIAAARPHWRLHLLGALRRPFPASPSNLVLHGEVDFATTLAHVAHADIGLAPYRDRPGVEYQAANSNRMLLYRHFGLPILAPDRLCQPGLPTVIGTGHLEQALASAEAAGKRPEALPDWSDLVDRLAQNGPTDPPALIATEPFRAT